MRRIIVAAGITLAMSANVLAGTWCDQYGEYYPLPVFCDSFDRHCNGPDNNPCPESPPAPYNKFYITRSWPNTSWSYHNIQDGVCGNLPFLTTEHFQEAQFTSVHHAAILMDGGDEAGILGQASQSMVSGIVTKFGSGYNRVYGTDDAQLVVEFNMASNIMSASSLDLSHGYVELALEEHTLTKQEFLALGYDPEVTPTDYIKVGGPDEMYQLSGTCLSCWGMCKNLGATDGRAPHHAWPTICQSYDARTETSLCPNPNGGDPIPCGPPYCPETPETKLHKTIAIGALAMLDPNPCHCENPVKPDNSHCGAGAGCNTATGFCNTTGGSAKACTTDADCPKEMQEYTNHTATNKHVAFFDGWKWRIISSAIFDDGQGNGIPGVIGSGDFKLGSKIDHVKLTIKSTTFKIEHWHAQNKATWILYAGNPLCEPDVKRDDTIAGGVTVTNPGSGYTSAPTVTVALPPSGRRATVTATVSEGAVVGLTITDPGMGYTSAPAITIAPPPSGTQATATATLGGAAHYELGQYSWADNIPRKYLGGFNTVRIGTSSNCRLCSEDLVEAGGDYDNCKDGDWDGTSYTCTEYNQNWNSGATWCKRMSGISGCYGTNIDDGSNFIILDDLAVTGGTPDTDSGACCYPPDTANPDGTCVFQTEEECTGTYNGDGSTCIGSPCHGACCGPEAACEVTNVYNCSGRYRGPNTDCNTPCCQSPSADWDADQDVDMDDFAVLQRCISTGGGTMAPNCACFDQNHDNEIDQDDILSFMNCATGPTVIPGTVSPECEP